MCHESQTSVHMWVKRGNDVGEPLVTDDGGLLKGMLRDAPARAVQLT